MVENHYDETAEHLLIKINGRFDYNCHKMFHDAFTTVPLARTYEVDLSGVSYLDSSGLGMLLLLRDHAGAENAPVFLSHCSIVVTDILKMANFNRLFTLSE